MIFINDKEVNFIYNLGEKVKEVFSYGTKIWPPEVLFDYMYFKLADGYTSGNVSYKFSEYYNLHNKYLKISTDGSNWSDWTEQISMAPNVKYFIKGEDDYVRNSYAGALEFFTSDVSTQNFNIECGGNIMSLVNLNENITATGCFSGLFYNMRNLVTAPKLPYLSVPAYGYAVMFNNTKSLTAAPELPATTIGENAYRSMFYSSGINTVPNLLPSTTLAPSCYLSMFADCKNLTVAPELPATTLADHCYDGMFKLSGITEAPELPATTLASYCYNGMFQNCKSLTIAPVLTATTLTTNCYTNMFYGCTSLAEITLNGDFNSSYATNWVRNVSTSGTFYNNSDLDIQVGVNGIPTGWTEIRPVKADYMYFKLADGAESGNVSYQFNEYYNLHNKYLKISTDGNNWSDWTEQISMLPNTKYYVKGEDDYVRNSDISGGFFSSDVSTQNFNIECGGNVMSLCNMATEINTNYCFRTLFQYMHNLVTPPKLPATTLSDYCYAFMFQNCYSLTQAPELPATTMKPSCYLSMFMGCKSITVAPELQSTTLANNCYQNLLRGTSITTAPELPATTLANQCYFSIFENCYSLTQAPELPATTLAKECYRSMFIGCTSLTQAPALPATTLAEGCYYRMFEKCSSLTQAPELPATTLKSNCYYQMFSNSNKLNWIKSLFTTTPSTSYTKSWVNGVSAQGIFVKNINATWTTTGVNAVPTGWTVIYFDQTEGKYYTTKTKEVECDQYGNVKADYMYFKLADGETSGNVSYKFDEYYNLHNKYLKIRTDGNNWQDWNEAISMTPNVKYYVKGEDNYVRNSKIDGGFFSSDVSENQFNIECGGDVMSLCNMATEITTNYCFRTLFQHMTNLVTPPKLPATTLANYCYQNMFQGCTSLTKAPELPATTLADYCYNAMLQGCKSLTQAPELPATTLANYCYSNMFNGCSSLTQAPELPTIQIVVSGCYNYMLYKSNKLNWIKAIFTTTPSTSYTKNWVNGVSAQGIFVKNINATWTTTGVNAVPTGWTVIYFDTTENKYYTTQTKEVECDKYGNVKQETDAMYFKLADGAESGNVSYQFDEYHNLHNKYLKYSTDGSNWSDWTEAISMVPNVKYYVKGEDSYVRNSDISSGFFSSDVSENQFNIECGGDVMSLCNMNENITTNYCFCRLFYNMKNLLTPPALPATTLANSCYYYMFSGCYSLTQAPALPATTLAEDCYGFMFFSCYKLVQAPELPATTLANNCYSAMFYNASKLNWIKALFTTTPNTSSTTWWVLGVSSQGVFVKNINATWTDTGDDSVPERWKVIYFDTTEGKYYTTKTKETECDKYGNPL